MCLGKKEDASVRRLGHVFDSEPSKSLGRDGRGLVSMLSLGGKGELAGIRARGGLFDSLFLFALCVSLLYVVVQLSRAITFLWTDLYMANLSCTACLQEYYSYL